MMLVEILSSLLFVSEVQTLSPEPVAQAVATQGQTLPFQPPPEVMPETIVSETYVDEEEVETAPETTSETGVPTSPVTSPVVAAPVLNLPDNPARLGNYRRDYEGPLSDAEVRYQANINNGVNNATVRSNLEGAWELSLIGSAPFVMFEFRQIDRVRERIDGAWRALGSAPLHYGFLSDVTRYGNELEVNFIKHNERSPHVLYLMRYTDDYWRGYMLAPDGTKQDVSLKRRGTQ